MIELIWFCAVAWVTCGTIAWCIPVVTVAIAGGRTDMRTDLPMLAAAVAIGPLALLSVITHFVIPLWRRIK